MQVNVKKSYYLFLDAYNMLSFIKEDINYYIKYVRVNPLLHEGLNMLLHLNQQDLKSLIKNADE